MENKNIHLNFQHIVESIPPIGGVIEFIINDISILIDGTNSTNQIIIENNDIKSDCIITIKDGNTKIEGDTSLAEKLEL